MPQTVRDFVSDSYQIVSSSTPTAPLYGTDQLKGIQFLNELISSFSGTGLMIMNPKQVDFTMAINQQEVTFGSPDLDPPVDVEEGRLANLQNAWLLLQGVTYPLIDESRNVFFDSYKYNPQEGLPRYCIITFQNDRTTMRVYPSPSQVYELSVYGKFELPTLTANSTMSLVPIYTYRWLKMALAKELARYKGRMQAWTADLQQELVDAKKDMQASTSINLAIQSDHDSYLNGSWRVKAGI